MEEEKYQDIFNIAPIIEISYMYILCDIDEKEGRDSL